MCKRYYLIGNPMHMKKKEKIYISFRNMTGTKNILMFLMKIKSDMCHVECINLISYIFHFLFSNFYLYLIFIY